MKNQKVLVTGAGGFVGSYLVEDLVKDGAEVRAFVHYNSRNDWGMLEQLDKRILREIEVVAGDMRDADTVRKIVNGCEVVYHLAALIGIPYSYHSPQDVVDTNIGGTLNILLAALNSNVEKVVHTSTSEVYGTAKYVPMDEEHPLNPQSPYAASKVGADQLALSFHRSFGLPVGIIRPFNIYGPRQSARAVIPTIIAQALGGSSIHIGSSYPTRDLTFVKDSVLGFISFAKSKKTVGEVVNLGSGYEISIEKIIDIIEKITNKKLKVVIDKKRIRPKKSEVDRLFSNSKKAERLFNWKPKTRLEDGLRKTILWMEKNIGRYKEKIYNI
ncbi:MAG: SDR family NAD(P)-dependent oxidoreductase [candidate division Zixibacteria bacterium]|nr:SDR family NAD(P)-dependent oxidoreductase [candidate division Zixibacteria bacterium]